MERSSLVKVANGAFMWRKGQYGQLRAEKQWKALYHKNSGMPGYKEQASG